MILQAYIIGKKQNKTRGKDHGTIVFNTLLVKYMLVKSYSHKVQLMKYEL